jgi:plasmid stabilization system protein ParE
VNIQYNPNFRKNFGFIWDYIAKDSVNRANNFKSKLKLSIQNLENFPYKYRQSNYYDDINIRDLIFKGYTVPYLINSNTNTIVILDIFKWSDR